MATVKTETENWAAGKLGNQKNGQQKMRRQKKWQQKINVGNTDNRINGNGKKR